MMMKKIPVINYTLLLLLFALITNLQATASNTTITSPNGKIKINFSLQGGEPYYSISFKEKTIVSPSILGLNLAGAASFAGNFEVKNTETLRSNETWEPVYGERQKVRDHYNQTSILLEETARPHRQLQLILRAYNEGVAFRYHIPEQEMIKEFTLLEELTQFKFSGNYKGYSIARPQDTYKKARKLNAISQPTDHPFTVQVADDLYISITEAAMDNYARLQLKPKGNQTKTFSSHLMGQVEAKSPFSTPWRVLLIGESPSELLASNDLILNLNPPNALEDVSWIRPGKAMRVIPPFTTQRAKRYVDFASQNGIQYIHFDTGWYGSEFSPEADPSTVANGRVQKYPDSKQYLEVDMDLPAIVDYAAQQDIGVILYVNHVGLENYNLDKTFAQFREWGISGVKFGFVNIGSQKWTNWLHDAVKTAAKYQLMVDIHDEYRPTGFSRTYPNLMTQEGIGGDETRPEPEHELILPFTRFLAGAADHTLVYYSDWLAKTHAFQLAASVVYYSPLQYIFWYDQPNEYNGDPALNFWKKVPTVWDNTRIIHGAIGEYITVARKSGQEWFVGTLNNETGRSLNIPLNFLKSNKQYLLTIYTDAQNADPEKYPVPVSINKFIVTAEDILKVDLVKGGGHAMHITPANEQALKKFTPYNDHQ